MKLNNVNAIKFEFNFFFGKKFELNWNKESKEICTKPKSLDFSLCNL